MTRPILVLGTEPRIVVAIARSLHRRGISVEVAALSPTDRRISSRAIREFHHLPGPQEASGEFIAALSQLIRTTPFDLLIPCSDSSLAVCAEHYAHLSAMLQVACPPPHVVRRILDKHFTLEAAQRCGIRIPRTYCLSSAEDLQALHDSARFPIVAKPRTKMQATAFKTRHLKSLEELEQAIVANPQFSEQNLLQEYFTGVGVGIEVLIHRGEPVAMFQHRRLKELPSTGGVSVLAIAEALDPMLAEQSLRLLRQLEWEGVAMVEFLHDRANQTAVLMEVNGRYWGSLPLALHAGVDFPVYQWQVLHGQRPIVKADYALGVRARWVTGDLLRLHGLFFESQDQPALQRARWKELLRFVTDFRPSTRGMLWSLTDPAPALFEFGREVQKLATSHLKAAIRKALPRPIAGRIRAYRELGPGPGGVYLRLQFLRAFGLHRDRSRRLPAHPQSVLFVCHGNIIRSPMAAALLGGFLPDSVRKEITIASAGLRLKPGNLADERACIAAREFGVSLDQHRVQPLTAEMAQRADVIFVMDFLNEAVLLSRYPQVRGRVFLLAAQGDGSGSFAMEIPDPYEGTLSDVRTSYRALEYHIRSLAKALSASSPARSIKPLPVQPRCQ